MLKPLEVLCLHKENVEDPNGVLKLIEHVTQCQDEHIEVPLSVWHVSIFVAEKVWVWDAVSKK